MQNDYIKELAVKSDKKSDKKSIFELSSRSGMCRVLSLGLW